MQDAAGDVTSSGDGHLDGGDDEAGLHAFVDRPADDPVREHVLDRAAVDLAFPRPVLGDVAQPESVGLCASEVALDEFVV